MARVDREQAELLMREVAADLRSEESRAKLAVVRESVGEDADALTVSALDALDRLLAAQTTA